MQPVSHISWGPAQWTEGRWGRGCPSEARMAERALFLQVRPGIWEHSLLRGHWGGALMVNLHPAPHPGHIDGRAAALWAGGP